MAVTEENAKKVMDSDEEEKWVKHYSSNHRILLVGEGDFSFSLSLALSFGSASNIVASSLDSFDDVTKKYKNAKTNLERLEELGGSHLHGVDAAKMMFHTDLKMQKFDRIIFSFPHAGFGGKEDDIRLINKHKELVYCFFTNSRGMLRANGEVHVNHKTTPPFCCWNLELLASRNSLALIEYVDFNKEDYPGYNNKRGDGSRCDEPFPLGKCSTFKFRFSPAAEKSKTKAHTCSRDVNSHQPQVPSQMQQWPVPCGSSITSTSNIPGYLMDRRFPQPHEVPSEMQQWPVPCGSGTTSASNIPGYLMDRRFQQPHEVPSQIQQWRVTSSIPGYSIDERLQHPHEVPSQMTQWRVTSSIPGYSIDERLQQPREVPSQLQYLPGLRGCSRFESLGCRPFGTRMSNIPLHSRNERSCQLQEAPFQMQQMSASLGPDTSINNICLRSRKERSLRALVASFGSIRSSIPVSECSLGVKLNNGGSRIYGRTGGDLTYPIREGPKFHYERFMEGPMLPYERFMERVPGRALNYGDSYSVHEPYRSNILRELRYATN